MVKENRSERKRQNIRYWTEFCDYLCQQGSQLRPLEPRRSDYNHYRDFQIGIPYFAVRASQRVKEGIAAVFVMKGSNATTAFDVLKQQQSEIETKLGGSPIWWDKAPRERRIAFLKVDANPTDETDWPNQHEWIASKLEKLNEVFRPRIDRLQVR